MAKPIRALKFHYPMIQFLIMINVCSILVITHQPQLGLVPGMIMIPIISTVACRMALV